MLNKLRGLTIQHFTPPILWHVYGKYFDRTKIFSSYSEAASACHDKGYEQNELVYVVQQKTKIFRDLLLNQAPLISDIASTRLFLALSLVKNTPIYIYRERGRLKLNVIDFGGACGAHYFTAKSLFNDINFRWHVVETPQMVKKGQEMFENEELKFFDDLRLVRENMESVELLYSSNCFQYVPEPYNLIKELVNFDAKFCFFTKIPLVDRNNEIVLIQESKLSENGHGPLPRGIQDSVAKYPATMLSKQKFETIVKEKFNLRLQFDEGKMFQTGNLTINGFGYFGDTKH